MAMLPIRPLRGSGNAGANRPKARQKRRQNLHPQRELCFRRLGNPPAKKNSLAPLLELLLRAYELGRRIDASG